jgi:hypothetical protein
LTLDLPEAITWARDLAGGITEDEDCELRESALATIG